MSYNRFHIACCGRSGSTYLYHALQKMGLSVLHESNHSWPFKAKRNIQYFAQHPEMFSNYQGIIGWKWTLLTPEYVQRFPIQFHLVRSPLAAIQSAMTHSNRLFNQVERHIGLPDFIPSHYSKKKVKLGRAINYWINYNRLVNTNKILLRLESFSSHDKSFKLFCKTVNCSTESGFLFTTLPSTINTRKSIFQLRYLNAYSPTLTWEYIKHIYPNQARILYDMALEYGYDPTLIQGKPI